MSDSCELARDVLLQRLAVPLSSLLESRVDIVREITDKQIGHCLQNAITRMCGLGATRDDDDCAVFGRQSRTPIFTTAAFSGVRLGELRALRWRDVDFPKRIIHVRRSYTMGLEDVPKPGR